MRPQENVDYIFIGTASLHQPDRTIASGPLLVTPKGIYYANYHTTDPFAGSREATSIKGAVADVKESVADLKAEFASLKGLGEVRKKMQEIVNTEPGIDQIQAKLDAWAEADSRLMRLLKDEIESIKTGFFAGLQVRMRNGAVHKFRSGKLKAISAMLS